MPGWHAATESLRKQGKLALLGITQEQHADRCRLFAQWKQFDWPILHDPINVTGPRVVPIVAAIDEHGVVRALGPKREWISEFVNRDFEPPESRSQSSTAAVPSIDDLLARAHREGSAEAWRALGDAIMLWGDPEQLDKAIDAYARSVRQRPDDAAAEFRLGVAHRRRHETEGRQPSDFQAAVEHWGRALELNPNQYIFRRRIQQYGPRLIKPYPFYDWVAGAQADIQARGETPVTLSTSPSGAEIAIPVRTFARADASDAEPDPEARINRDLTNLIRLEATIVPARIAPGRSARLHLEWRPESNAHWNNEAEPLVVWLNPPEGWQLERQVLRGDLPRTAESREPRSLEVEIQAPDDARGSVVMRGYALYYVCEDAGGTCLYLRQDFAVDLPLSGSTSD